MYMTKGSVRAVRIGNEMLVTDSLPQLAVRAMKEGVVERDRWSRPIKGAPSDPLKDDPDPDTQRYFVDTVCDRNLWKREIVEP